MTVKTYRERLTSENVDRILGEGWDLIVDGADNFPTRYLVNDASVWHDIPVVHGSIYRFEGQVTVFKPHEGPCYRCLFPQPPPPELAPSCSEGGVLGVLPRDHRLDPGERGAQARGRDRRHRSSAGCCSSTRSRSRSPRSSLQRDPDCPVCGEHPTITEYVDYVEFCAGGRALVGVEGADPPGAARRGRRRAARCRRPASPSASCSRT